MAFASEAASRPQMKQVGKEGEQSDIIAAHTMLERDGPAAEALQLSQASSQLSEERAKKSSASCLPSLLWPFNYARVKTHTPPARCRVYLAVFATPLQVQCELRAQQQQPGAEVGANWVVCLPSLQHNALVPGQ